MSGWFDTILADDLPSRAVTVYMYLRSRADREGKCCCTGLIEKLDDLSPFW